MSSSGLRDRSEWKEKGVTQKRCRALADDRGIVLQCKGQRFDIYYCHSYSAWEKGSNENHNRMIRRFLPKGTNFDEVSSREIRKIQDWMNHYPRRSLNWSTPAEIAG